MKNSIYSALIAVLILNISPVKTTQAAELSFEADKALPLVYITVAFKGGATQDPDGKNGVTDIMGKLMLRGTKNKTKSQIDLALDTLGANLNVETRAEFIAFRGSVLSENVGPFLSLLGEIITAPSFRPQELEKLKKEQVSNLLDELNQDAFLARLRYDQTFFKGHPYSKSNVGRIKDIQTLTANDLERHYQKLIHDNLMVVVAAGDAQEKEFKPFMDLMVSKKGTVGNITQIPEFKNEPQKIKVVIWDKPERTQTQVIVGQKGTTFLDPRMDALEIGNFVYGGHNFQARLMTELRVKRGWTYGAGSAFKIGSKPHTWKMSFMPKNADTAPAIQYSLQMMNDFHDKGITAVEIERAKQAMINGAGFTYDTPAKRMENKLTEKLFGLPDGYFKGKAGRLEKTTLEQVNQSVKEFLTPGHVLIGVVATASASKAEIAKTLGIPEKEIEVQDHLKE